MSKSSQSFTYIFLILSRGSQKVEEKCDILQRIYFHTSSRNYGRNYQTFVMLLKDWFSILMHQILFRAFPRLGECTN